jgi:hypothetical protein
MQYVDGPAHIQGFAEPAGVGCVRTEPKALRSVTGSQQSHRITVALARCRHFGERSTVRSPELERPVGPTRRLITLLVHGVMVPAAEKSQIRQRGGASLGPVVEMMPLGDTDAAAREATTPVPML